MLKFGLWNGYTKTYHSEIGQLDVNLEKRSSGENRLPINANKHLMVKSEGDDTLENMRITSLEKDSDIIDDDEAIQVLRINEHGEAVEVVLGDDDFEDEDGSLILQPEKIVGEGISIDKLRDSEKNGNG